jgi:hypothetical protein
VNVSLNWVDRRLSRCPLFAAWRSTRLGANLRSALCDVRQPPPPAHLSASYNTTYNAARYRVHIPKDTERRRATSYLISLWVEHSAAARPLWRGVLVTLGEQRLYFSTLPSSTTGCAKWPAGRIRLKRVTPHETR